MEENQKEEDIYISPQITLLYTWHQHNTVNQRYFKKKNSNKIQDQKTSLLNSTKQNQQQSFSKYSKN